MQNQPYVYFEDQIHNRQRLYTNPHDIITARSLTDIDGAFKTMQTYHDAGFYLAGYFSYELGYFLEPSLHKYRPNNISGPLLEFGVFEGFERRALPVVTQAEQGRLSGLKPQWSQIEYTQKFSKIMAYIRKGDVYQINLSFPVTGTYLGSAPALYQHLKPYQPVHYGGVIGLGAETHITLSPELFFKKTGDKIYMRPMKGTVKRGDTPAQDKALSRGLQKDEKNRAENLMIVDLLRNDVSRISQPGSVKVKDLFSLETFPTLHTMTSGIEAKLKPTTNMQDIARALFPCGSITGAPKIRAQEIIRELETHIRGSYCGALGFIDPGGDMRFNVGIRTLTLKQNGQITYPVGSGVVADSKAADEYAECLLKAKFLQEAYTLIETIGYDQFTGYMHFGLHLSRLQRSAKTLGFVFDRSTVKGALIEYACTLKGPHKIRLELSKNGYLEISHQALKPEPFQDFWPVTLSKNPVDSQNKWLAHKTNRRHFITGELLRLFKQTGCREVLFFNERDQLCEGSFTNVFMVKNGVMFTPPLCCGLLPGILRHVLLSTGDAYEKVLTRKDLREADEIYIGNSARGLMRVRLTGPERL